MSKNTEAPNPVIDELMRRKFGRLLSWQTPEIRMTVGPFDPTVFEDFERRRDVLVAECRRFLAELADPDLSVLYQREFPDTEGKREAWEHFLRSEVSSLSSKTPPWMAGGFGNPEYEADFNYWGKMENYTLHEALILSIGVEPEHIGQRRLEEWIKESERVDLIAPLKFLVRRHEQFRRWFPRGSFGPASVDPKRLITWFEEVDLEVHPSFAEKLRVRREKYLRPLKKRVEEGTETAKKPDKREINTICQLFAAMAIDVYGYDPTSARSTAPKEIVELAASMGITISDDTVRKYLRKGASFISDDWRPN